MADIEKLVRDRIRIVFAMAITFAVWQGGDIVAQIVVADSSLFLFASLTKGIGAVAYALSALFLFLFYRRVKKANAAATLKDDWNRLTTGLAVQYGFIFLIGATSLMYAASIFWALPTMAILQGLILVGVSGTLLAFAALQRKGDRKI